MGRVTPNKPFAKFAALKPQNVSCAKYFAIVVKILTATQNRIQGRRPILSDNEPTYVEEIVFEINPVMRRKLVAAPYRKGLVEGKEPSKDPA
jgi:hypothetical protein